MAGGVAGEIDQDVDAVGADARLHLLIRHPGDGAPAVDGLLDAPCGFVDHRAVGVGGDVNLIAVKVFQQRQQEICHRMLSQIGRDVAHPELALRIAVVVMPNQPALQMRLMSARPTAVFVHQFPRPDPGLVIQEHQQVAVGGDESAVEFDRLAERRDSLVHPAEVFQGQSQAVVRIGQLGIETDRGLERGDGLVVVACGTQRIAEVVVGSGVAGVQFDTAPHHCDDEIRPPGHESDLREAVEHIHVVRKLRKQHPQESFGLAQIPGPQTLHRGLVDLPRIRIRQRPLTGPRNRLLIRVSIADIPRSRSGLISFARPSSE